IGDCNISWVEEFYANAYGRDDDDYTSYVRRVEISYAPDVIDTIFWFRPEEHCMARIGAMTAMEDVHTYKLRRWIISPRHGPSGWFATSSAVRTRQRSS
ncbi:hypothetical protein A2U01_0052943, partial [Trifolium medium]|nr:hypothetical protein [Trifolium medium]